MAIYLKRICLEVWEILLHSIRKRDSIKLKTHRIHKWNRTKEKWVATKEKEKKKWFVYLRGALSESSGEERHLLLFGLREEVLKVE